MPLLENTQPTPKSESSFDQQTATNTKNETNNNSKLMTIIGQCLPFAPLVWEQFTGQKVPQLSGTMTEITNSLQQLQLTLTQVLANQQQLNQRLVSLENSANHLTHQFKSLTLTHTKEHKQIEFDRPSLENPTDY